MTIIIGIDPGSINTGYGIIRKVGSRIEHIDSGVISIKGSDINSRLPIIFTRLLEILQQYKPDHMVIEQVFLADNPQSAIKLGMARGVAILAGSLCQCVIFELSARQAKKFVTGMGNAQKEQVNRMVCRMLGLQDPPRLDASDALALAISHAQTINTRLLIAAKSQALVNNRSQHRLAQNTHNHQVLSEMVEQFEGEREVEAEIVESEIVAGESFEGMKSIEGINGVESTEFEGAGVDEIKGLGTNSAGADRAANSTTSNTSDCANTANYTNYPNFEQHNSANPTPTQAHSEISESAVTEATTSRQISDESLNFTSDLIAAISQQLSEQRQANWEEELRSGAGYHPSWMEEEIESKLEVDVELGLKNQVINQEEVEQKVEQERATCKVIEQEVQEDQKTQAAQRTQDDVPTTVLVTQAQGNLDAQVTTPVSDSQTVLAALINSDLTQFAPLTQVPLAQVSESNSNTTYATTNVTVATLAKVAKIATVNTTTSDLSSPATLAHSQGYASSSPSYNPVLQNISWEHRSTPASSQQNARARGNLGATITNLGTSANQLTSKAQLRALVQSQFGKINGSQLSNSNKLSALARNSQAHRSVTGNATATVRNNATSPTHSETVTASSKPNNVSQLANVTQSSDQELLSHTQHLNLTLGKANPSTASTTNSANLESTNHEPTQGIQSAESSPDKFTDKLVSYRDANSNFQVPTSTTPHNTTATPMHDTLSQLMSELTTQGVDKVLQQLDGNLSSNVSTPAVTNLNVTLTAEQLELDRASLSNFKINAKRFQVKTGKSNNRTKLETKIKKSRKQDT